MLNFKYSELFENRLKEHSVAYSIKVTNVQRHGENINDKNLAMEEEIIKV